MSRSALSLTLLFVASPAVASDLGSCLTEAGVRLAPHTDPRDPACGEDCGLDDETPILCSTADGTCEVERERLDWGPLARLLLEASRTGPAPICIEAGPECSRGEPVLAGGPVVAMALELDPRAIPRRGTGTLPGAGAPDTTAHACERDRLTPRRPPRA